MVRRSLGAALWSLAGLLACFLGALAALVGTGAGRTLLARVLAGTLDRVVAGRIEVGDVGGTLFTGVVLTDVTVYDPDSTLVARLPLAELAYNPFDFAAGQIVLHEVRLDRPEIYLVQHANGRLNFEELLRLGEPDSGPRGPKPLIVLRQVRIDSGTVVLKLQDRVAADDSLQEIESAGADGRWRVRHFERVQARLRSLQLSAPREPGIRADVERLAVEISDPPVRLRDAAGRIAIVGDSIEADFERFRLPRSELALAGRVSWPRDTLLWDLDVVADSAALTDIAFIEPRFPAGARLRGAVAVRSLNARTTQIRLDPIEVRHRGGVLTGRVTVTSLAGTGLTRVRDGDLTADDVDLELVRPFLDTLPFAGRLTGRTIVDGPVDSLALDVDWAFRDSLVSGWPETRIAGNGVVNLGHPEGLAFQAFAVREAGVDLGTARRLIPALALYGRLDGAGTLDGPLTNARWSGTLRHQDGDRPASVVRGTLRVDARRDTLALDVDLTADTLALAGLRRTIPGRPLAARVAGPIRLAGTLAALAAHADVVSLDRAGRVRLDGTLTLLPPELGARELRLVATEVDLQRWVGGDDVPTSRLTVIVTGDVTADSAAPPAGALRVQLAPSLLAGTVIDSGLAELRMTGGLLQVDTLRLELPAVRAAGRGTLGWRGPDAGRFVLDLEADSLRALDSLGTWLAGLDTGRTLNGAARLRVTLAGALDSLVGEARGELRDVEWRDASVPAATVSGRWVPGERDRFELDVAADSVAFGGIGFGGVAARVAGRLDSLTWFGRSRVGDWLAVLGGGALARHAGVAAVRFDSAAVLLPGEVWLLAQPATVTVDEERAGVSEGGLVFRSARDSGRVTVAGALPVGGAGSGEPDALEETNGATADGARVQARGLPLAALIALVTNDPTGAQGRVNADVSLRGTRRDPVLESTFTLSGVAGRSGEPLAGRGEAHYRARRLDGRLQVSRGDRRIVDVTAHLPLDLALTAVARRQLPDTLSVRAVVDSVDLVRLDLLGAAVSDVRGLVSGDVQLRGTWDAPALRGGFEVRGGAATFRTLNVRYEDITGRLSLAADTIRVDTLTLRSGEGRLAVSGVVRLERLTRPLLDLSLVASEFRALEIRNQMAVTATGRVGLRGPLLGATLSGRGTVTSGVIYFADLVTKRVVNLDEPWVATLIEPELLREPALARGFHSRFLDSLRIRDLTLVMGSDVWLRSNEANIQLTGGVDVTKEGFNYVFSGTLQAPRGTYRLVVGAVVTREFVVTGGTVRYFGTSDLNAELNITARHVVHPVPTSTNSRPGDVAVVANIGGTLLVPRLTLSAEGQTLSQTEIISYLMFGKASFELAGEGSAFGGQRALLQSTVASLVSGELERTLVSELGVPVDYVEIRPGDPLDPLSGALLAAGWQIGSRTFLTLNAGFCEGRALRLSNTLGATFQYRLSPEWRTEASFEPVRTCGPPALEASTSVQRQLGFDLLWERRY